MPLSIYMDLVACHQYPFNHGIHKVSVPNRQADAFPITG